MLFLRQKCSPSEIILLQRRSALELSAEDKDPAGVHDRGGHVQRVVPPSQSVLSGNRLRIDPD